MELEVFFTIIQQTYSKLFISFMNRKSSCGYATHFFFLFLFFYWDIHTPKRKNRYERCVCHFELGHPNIYLARGKR
jgi:hypothetical protein